MAISMLMVKAHVLYMVAVKADANMVMVVFLVVVVMAVVMAVAMVDNSVQGSMDSGFIWAAVMKT